MSEKTANLLRKITLVIFGLAVAFTLLGGLGNTCVAFNAKAYGKAFEGFIPYAFEYQMFVYIGIVMALLGLVALWGMVKGKKWAYALGLVVLIVCVVAALAQMYYTSTIKQVSFFKTPPTNMRMYTTVLALIVLLIVRLPGIWKHIDFTKSSSKKSAGPAAGLTACAMGVLTITTPLWAGASHMVDGYNTVLVLGWQLNAAGIAMIVGGLAAMAPERVWAPARRLMARFAHD